MAWDKPRVLIIGAGAVGCFIGARLALAETEVSLVGRGALLAPVATAGLRLTEPDDDRFTDPLPLFTSLADACGGAPYDLGILTAKAYDTAAVVAELRAATRTPPPLLSLQNGVGNEETLADAFGPDRVISGAIETPVSLPAPGVVTVHRARYRAGLAPVGSAPLAARVARLLIRAGLNLDLYSDYHRLKWSKLLLNLPANATCAILDWTPARVIHDPRIAPIESRAWQETFRTMRALGIRPVNLAGYPLAAIAPIVPALPPALLARVMARTVAGGRGSKMPSFHVALSAGKRSEVRWLNGAVARAGSAVHVPTPVNAALTSVLSTISSAPETWPDWQDQPRKLAGRIAAANSPS